MSEIDSTKPIIDIQHILENLQLSNESLFDCNPSPMWIYNLTAYRIMRVNEAAIIQYGYSRDEFLQMTIFDLRPESEVKKLEEYLTANELYFERSGIWKHQKKNGDIFFVDIISHSLPCNNGCQCRLVIANDVTERVRAEEELRDNEAMFRSFIEGLPEAIIILDDMGISYVNTKTEVLFGYAKKELIGQAIEQLMPERFRHKHARHRETFLENHRHILNKMREVQCMRKDGSEFIGEIILSRIELKKKSLISASIRDITEKKKIEEALRLSKLNMDNVLNTVSDFVWSVSLTDNKVLYANPAVLDIYGIPPEEFFKEPDVWLKIAHPDDRPMLEEDRKGLFARGWFDCEYRVIVRTNITKWVHGRGKVIYDENHVPIRLDGVISDITEHKADEQRIRESLKEKETLLREIHHRVKNNLQIISSLIRMEAPYIKDKAAREIFLSNHNRIRSIALIHQKLYQSKNLSQIDFSQYIEQLVKEIFSIYLYKKAGIELTMECADIKMGIETAFPCGLLISEIITNSIKHAFPDNKEGMITIQLSKGLTNDYLLVVGDNGIGMPKELDLSNPQTMGLQLIMTLAEQLDASIEIQRDTGTEYRFSFVEQNYNTRM